MLAGVASVLSGRFRGYMAEIDCAAMNLQSAALLALLGVSITEIDCAAMDLPPPLCWPLARSQVFDSMSINAWNSCGEYSCSQKFYVLNDADVLKSSY